MIIKRYKYIRNKRGVTLVELIVAMAVTVILIASLGSLMVPIHGLYTRSENRVIMDTVGQKILDELAVSAASSSNLVVHTASNPTVPTDPDGKIFKIYKSGDFIYKRFRTGDNIHILTSANSYQNCKVVSLDFYAEKIEEGRSFEDQNVGNFVRILYIRIKLSLNGLESNFMFTTVKIYNFSTSGNEILNNNGTVARTDLNHRTQSGFKSILITPNF